MGFDNRYSAILCWQNVHVHLWVHGLLYHRRHLDWAFGDYRFWRTTALISLILVIATIVEGTALTAASTAYADAADADYERSNQEDYNSTMTVVFLHITGVFLHITVDLITSN